MDAAVVQNLAKAVADGGYRRVALQFPDSWLRDAPEVVRRLEAASDVGATLFFILGDTNYGECCADEVAAEHLNADLLIHFGHACLSPTRRLPVVFQTRLKEHLPIETAVLEAAIGSTARDARLEGREVALLYDVELYGLIRDIPLPGNIIVAEPRVSIDEGTVLLPQSFLELPSRLSVGPLSLRVTTVSQWIYVGWERSIALRNFLLHHRASLSSTLVQTILLDESGKIEVDGQSTRSSENTYATDRILKRRFATLQKVQGFDRIGIIAGTLAIGGQLEVMARCKELIISAGKNCYYILVGKPNPAKLANFPDLDAFVLIACPENSLLDNDDYLQPIITPYELEISLQEDGVTTWTGGGFPLELSSRQSRHATSMTDNSDDVQIAVRPELAGLSNDGNSAVAPSCATVGSSGRSIGYDGEPKVPSVTSREPQVPSDP